MASSRQPRPARNFARNGRTTPVTSARKKLAAFRPTRLCTETGCNPAVDMGRTPRKPLAPEGLDLRDQLVKLVLQRLEALFDIPRPGRGRPAPAGRRTVGVVAGPGGVGVGGGR